MTAAIEMRPAYAHKIKTSKEVRTLTFESDGAPALKEFSAWGMTVVNVWADSKSTSLIVRNGNVYFHAPSGTRVFVTVQL